MEHKEVFISYKSEDFDQANWLKTVLETNGISCWMAPASIPGGSNYAKEIPLAIENCRVFVLVMTRNCQNSIWIPKELDRALNCRKPVMPFVLEDCELNDDFNFYLSNVQRYAAYQNKMNAAEQMVKDIRALLNVQQTPVRPVAPQRVKKTGKKHGKLLAAAIAAVVALCILAVIVLTGADRVDIFETLQIEFVGAAPYASVKLTNTSPDPFVQSISFTATPDSNLDLGDTVTVSADITQEDAKAQGYNVDVFSKQIVVENIPSAVSDPALLNAEDVAALQERMEVFIRGKGTGYPSICYADGSEVDLSADNFANCMTAFAFLEKGYVCRQDLILEQKNLLFLPFCVSLEDVPYSWVDNQYYENPVLVDFPALYGYFYLQDLMMDETGSLIKEGSFGIEMSKLYESREEMEMNLSKWNAQGEMTSGILQTD